MSERTSFVLPLLRIALGWIYLYAGLSKLIQPEWSAEGYLKNAKTFTDVYHWFASPNILPMINLINEWGLFFLGVSLVLGLFVRLSSALGIFLMVLYYLPVLNFPYVGKNAFLIDEHIIYILILLCFIKKRAGMIFGLDAWCTALPICKRFPKLRKIFG